MSNMFWNQYNNQRRGYSDGNELGNANHSQYQNWSNNWGTQKQNNTSFTWDYFDDSLKEQKHYKQPSKSFDMNEFMSTDFYNPNDMRSDGSKTNRWDIDQINTNFLKTSYGRKDENFHTLANGVPYNDKNVKLNGNNYQYFDEETNQYHDIYALGTEQLKEYGHHKNKNVNIWDNDIYGSLINVYHEDGSTTTGIVMDGSSMGNKKANLDQWTEYVDPNNETVSFEFKRIGWGSTQNPKR